MWLISIGYTEVLRQGDIQDSAGRFLVEADCLEDGSGTRTAIGKDEVSWMGKQRRWTSRDGSVEGM